MRPVYVLIEASTGKLWKKKSQNGRRGVYAFLSEEKAIATLKQFFPEPAEGEVIVQKYEATEHNS